MRTSRTTATACGAAACLALAAFSIPSQAQAAPPADGCYKIVEGTASLTRHVSFTPSTGTAQGDAHGPDLQDASEHYHPVEYPTFTKNFTGDAEAVVRITIDNAGSDCSDVRYRLRVLDEQSRLVTEAIVPGGSTDTVLWKSRFAYPYAAGRFAYVSVTSETSRGRVIDTAPDAAPGVQVNLAAGGATSSFN